MSPSRSLFDDRDFYQIKTKERKRRRRNNDEEIKVDRKENYY